MSITIRLFFSSFFVSYFSSLISIFFFTGIYNNSSLFFCHTNNCLPFFKIFFYYTQPLLLKSVLTRISSLWHHFQFFSLYIPTAVLFGLWCNYWCSIHFFLRFYSLNFVSRKILKSFIFCVQTMVLAQSRLSRI